MPITQAITKYQSHGCESSFDELYYYIYSNGGNIVKSFSNRYKLDEHDVKAMIDDKIFEIAGKFEGESPKFRNAVYSAIKNGCIDLVRKDKTQAKYRTEVMYEDDDGNEKEIYEIVQVASTTVEDDYTATQKKRDQRQLVTHLLLNVSEPTLTSALTFLETKSCRQAAIQLGASHNTVKARIRKLAKRFDEKQFGNYNDYFTTATTHIG